MRRCGFIAGLGGKPDNNVCVISISSGSAHTFSPCSTVNRRAILKR